MAGCEAAEVDEDAKRLAQIEQDELDEVALFEAVAAETEQRRSDFEQFGIVPPPPAELVAMIPADELVFEGYGEEATQQDLEEEAARDAADQAAIEAALAAGEETPSDETPSSPENDFGVFKNSAGEVWRWVPTDVEATRARLRSLDESFETEDVSASHFVPAEEAEYAQDKLRDIIGGDQRELRSADNSYSMTSYPYRAIGALVDSAVPSWLGPDVDCTAHKIGPRHLLTSAHCINSGNMGPNAGWKPRKWWPGADGIDRRLNGGDPSPNGTKGIIWAWVHSGWLDHGTTRDDYAVLILSDTAATCGLGWLGYNVDYSLAATGHHLWGFPGETLNCAASPLSNDNCDGSMYGDNRNIIRTTTRWAFYRIDTQGGQSGSGVYEINGSNRKIHAIHRGPFGSVENRGVKIRSNVFSGIHSAKSAWPSAVCP